MNLNVATNISNEFKEVEVIINAPEMTEDVKNIVNNIIQISNNVKQIIGTKDNKIFFIKIDEIVCFYSEEKNNYCKTMKETYKINEKLYELEEKLCKRKFY